jgi:hypothetical protein
MNNDIYKYEEIYNLSNVKKKYNKKTKESFQNTSDNFKKIWKHQCSQYNINVQPSILPKAERIVVIGDLHGDLEMTFKSLQIAKVIDMNHNWIGGNTIIVQVGDQIDRCRFDGKNSCNQEGITKFDEHSDIRILKYFTKLHHQAQKKGGAVYSLLGNHELMNVNGDMRYVSHEGIKGFDNYKKLDGTIIENGMDARKFAFAPGNPISNFLACTRQVALIIGSNLFVHAGILPSIAEKYKIEDINKLMTLFLLDKLKDKEEYNKIFNNFDSSPLWTRKIGNMGIKEDNNKDSCNDLLKPLNKNYKVKNIYVGHTPLLDKGISSICDDKIWLTDYGSSKAFDIFASKDKVKEVQVLEILNDNVFNVLK